MTKLVKRVLYSSLLVLGILGTSATLNAHATNVSYENIDNYDDNNITSYFDNFPDNSDLIDGDDSATNTPPNSVDNNGTNSSDTNKLSHHVLLQLRHAIKCHNLIKPSNKINKLSNSDRNFELKLIKQNNKLLKQEMHFDHYRHGYHYRHIASNTRDLGGYKTINGTITKPKLLIRSNNLYNLTKSGAQELEKTFDVKNIIDLRTDKQIAHRPDADEFHSQDKNRADFHSHFNHDEVYSTKAFKDDNKGVKEYGEPYRYTNIYSLDPQAMHAYHEVFHQILSQKKGATIYHCIAGRDRTGITSVLILSSLGVPKSTIVKDYLLTDYYSPRFLLSEQLQSIQSFYQAVDSKYGNINNYLDAIGMTSAKRTVLQKRYVESIKKFNKNKASSKSRKSNNSNPLINIGSLSSDINVQNPHVKNSRNKSQGNKVYLNKRSKSQVKKIAHNKLIKNITSEFAKLIHK